ncbi:SSU ribosomal protein S9P [Flammula alnicola]|nr:SSU ribosomal protein S9P [Flammula alnicola]
MNILRPSLLQQALRLSSGRNYACARAFTSTTRRQDEEPRSERSERAKPIPQSPSFYTTRAVFYDQLIHLEKAIGRSEAFLRHHHLLPLPDFAKASLPPLQPVWKNQLEMAVEFKTQLTTTRYRKITKLLNQLNDFQRIAKTGGCPELEEKLASILSMYESSKKEAFLARGKRKTVALDEYGRSYALGKRKTSSARVWMIPVQRPQDKEQTPEAMLGVEQAQQTYPVTTTTILVNNLPLNQFFPLPADRERITRPLKVAGVLGKYNVFAIVRGGGTTGQSGALAHGIAKGIVAHDPELEVMFRRAKLTRRDPRMVERKKTGLAKARKRYAWVKR